MRVDQTDLTSRGSPGGEGGAGCWRCRTGRAGGGCTPWPPEWSNPARFTALLEKAQNARNCVFMAFN